MSLRFVTGDATRPEGDGLRVVAHVANNLGAWGAGFVVALSRRWPQPEQVYRAAPKLKLGTVQFVEVEPNLVVANMVAQDGFPTRGCRCALDYDALAECLVTVAEYCAEHGASFNAPRFGAGIAGGSWPKIETMLRGTMGAHDVDVTIYDLPLQTRAP